MSRKLQEMRFKGISNWRTDWPPAETRCAYWTRITVEVNTVVGTAGSLDSPFLVLYLSFEVMSIFLLCSSSTLWPASACYRAEWFASCAGLWRVFRSTCSGKDRKYRPSVPERFLGTSQAKRIAQGLVIFFYNLFHDRISGLSFTVSRGTYFQWQF